MKKVMWFTFAWIVLGLCLNGLFLFAGDIFSQKETEVYLTQFDGGDFATTLQRLTISHIYASAAGAYIVFGIAGLGYLFISALEKGNVD